MLREQLERQLRQTDLHSEIFERLAARDICSFDELAPLMDFMYRRYIPDETGREVFDTVVIPQARKVYGDNWTKMGFRLINIIQKGATYTIDDREAYFKTAISQEELAYAEQDKEKIVDGVRKAIEQIILDLAARYGGQDQSVVAVVLAGSFAAGNFHFHSDIDLSVVLGRDVDRNRTVCEAGQFLLQIERDFLKELETRLPAGHSFDMLTDGLSIDANIPAYLPDYIDTKTCLIISPHKQIKEQIDALFAQAA